MFDAAFGGDARNEHVYARAVADLVPLALRGGRGCCFALGQTGSGKTHTLMGEPGVGGAGEATPRPCDCAPASRTRATVTQISW